MRDVIHVTHHLFLLAAEGYHPGGTLPPISNGLAESIEDCAVVHTGVHSGLVTLRVQVSTGPPDAVEAGWEDVVEINLRAGAGRVKVASVLGGGIPDTFPTLTPAGPGNYRVRVHARGRDTDVDGTALEPFEDYLVQIWAAPPQAQTVYRNTDRYGAELRLLAAQVAPQAEPGRRPEPAEDERLNNLRTHSTPPRLGPDR
ncbi:MAG TPA: hypothetical protein VGQ42_13470 [Candidatus Dormibacteraeota bacterium]|nr:hypothetical protein [Candidatus Dormibacteraeota bacterium]